MTTLEKYIGLHARNCPDKVAIVCQHEQCTYRCLHERIGRRVEEMKGLWRARDIVCLRAQPTIDYLVDYFAVHVAGCVAAPLERDLPEETYQAANRMLCRHQVQAGTADVLYTTGTTGRAKGVAISHQTILADAENLIDGQGFTPELAFVINGPLNHIGSLSKVWPLIMQGATVILVDGLKDLDAFFDAFDYPAPKVATFLVPASIRMIIRFGAQRLAALADKMDFIETGAAAIAQSDMTALCRLLPRTRLYNTYASTETGIISTYNYNEGQCLPGCLGRPMKHSRIVITPEGLIACMGPTLMTGYVGDDALTASVLRDGVLYTSDIGEIDDQGLLHLKGRQDDVINVGGFKVARTEVEDAALAFPNVKDCVCMAVDHPITGKALKLLVVTNGDNPLDKRALAVFLKSRLENYKVPLQYATTDHIERTFNGKINRAHYNYQSL